MQDVIMLHNVVLDDKYLPSCTETIIAAEGWRTDDSADYPAYYDIPVNNVTVKHKADVFFVSTDIEKANACGIAGYTETLNGVVRIRAIIAPEDDLAATICLSAGKEIQNAGND